MWQAFKQGYGDSGAPAPHMVAGRVLGLWVKWAACTVVVVWTARAVGVQV